MGLFGFWNKKGIEEKTDKRKVETQEIGVEEIKRRWEEAYRANPHLYEKEEEGKLIVSFALTEDTDSLFPYYPEKQWKVPDKEISLWMITMISLTNPEGGVIGQMEYHEAMNRLQPYILANADGWVFIRAMTHAELDALFGNLPRKLI